MFLEKQVSVLELGTFTGRITRKLEVYFKDITTSDVFTDGVYKANHKFIRIDLTDSKKLDLSYDFVISLGHQVSFSNDINCAISNMASYLNKNGFILFDIWNEDFLETHPTPYLKEKTNINKITSLLEYHNIRVINIFYGARIFNVINRIPILARMVNKNKFMMILEGFFIQNKSAYLSRKTQTIYIIGKKIV